MINLLGPCVFSLLSPCMLQVVVSMNSAAVSGSGLGTTISNADIDYISFKGTLISLASPDVIIRRTVEVSFVLAHYYY